MNPSMLLSSLLLLLASLLLLSVVLELRRRARQVVQRLDGKPPATIASANGCMRWAPVASVSSRSSSITKPRALLNRLGWRTARKRAILRRVPGRHVPVLALALSALVQGLFFAQVSNPWIAPTFALGIGYLLPKRLLATAAHHRQKKLAIEIATFIPLLRILFESGMAVEQSLRVMSNEGKQLLPILTHELRLILARVDSGLELGEELNKASRMLAVDEFTDTCVILQQLIHQGGGAMKSLLALKQLLDDRRLTRLQEYISKMSAKMSVVMMLFLFPALLIVLAGPGLTALARAFAS
jgi:tight adherence protein C